MAHNGAGPPAIRIGLSLSDRERSDCLAGLLAEEPDLLRADVEACDIVICDGDGTAAAASRCMKVVWSDREIDDFGPTVRAVLPESLSPRDVVAAVRLVAAGLVVHSEGADDTAAVGNTKPDADALEIAKTLTFREHQVLQLLSAGASNKVIAIRLGLSVHTVKFHVASILAKLDASSRLEAVGIGLRMGIVMV
jgi:DNA-binding NarL/FixJ family response regulator